jgi:tetratricopeptide (TPR) repeat protein
MNKTMKDLMTYKTDDRFAAEIRDGQALLELARGWLAQGSPVVAIELLRSALGSDEAENNPTLKAGIFKETGRAMMMQSDWKSAEPYYQGAQRLYLQIGDLKGAAECARNRANMYFQCGKYLESESLCEQALEWTATLNDHQLRATILNTLGAIKSATGLQKEAIKIFKLCLADFEAAGNCVRQGYALLNIGLALTEMGEYPEAVQYLRESLAIAFAAKDLQLVAICYQNIARCHLAQRETIMARSVLNTARKVLPGLNSRALEIELDLIDCKIMHAMGDMDGAEELLRRTHDRAADNQMTALQADVLMEQGLLLKDKGMTPPAACKLDAAAHLYRQLGMEKNFRDAILALDQLKRNANA